MSYNSFNKFTRTIEIENLLEIYIVTETDVNVDNENVYEDFHLNENVLSAMAMLSKSSDKPSVPSNALAFLKSKPAPSSSRQYFSTSDESDPYTDSVEDYIPSELSDSNHLSAVSNKSEYEDYNSKIDQFPGQNEVKLNYLDLSSPYEIFEKFITDEILNLMVQKTNSYAALYIRTHQLGLYPLFKNRKTTVSG